MAHLAERDEIAEGIVWLGRSRAVPVNMMDMQANSLLLFAATELATVPITLDSFSSISTVAQSIVKMPLVSAICQAGIATNMRPVFGQGELTGSAQPLGLTALSRMGSA